MLHLWNNEFSRLSSFLFFKSLAIKVVKAKDKRKTFALYG